MSHTVEFLFDFASPNVYLAQRVLPGIVQRAGAKLQIVPCLLGGIFKLASNQSPMASFAQVKGKLEYETLETQRFIEKHGLNEFKMNPYFPLNSLQLMRGLVAAQQSDVADKYIDVISTAMWERGEKLDDAAVIERVLRAGGLDGAALLAKTQTPEVKAQLLANTEAAVRRGAFGLPTFFVGQEMFFGKERLGQIEELLRS
jgi:2-hydroxychromene-2-carboxylate isomerase